MKSGGRATGVWAALWVLYSAWAVGLGWVLSVFQMVHGPVYAVCGVLFLLLAGALAGPKELREWGRSAIVGLVRWRHLGASSKLWKNPRRWLPVVWALLAVLALVGGAMHAPNNYDFLTYRFPRLLHWGWEGGWHWIPSGNDRMNYSGAGFEWMILPWFQWTGSDRFFFLVNWIPYVLLPGLIYSVFTRLGVGRKTAWGWMWLLPSGYCYIMQAGSAGNDACAAFYLLAALHFGLVARERNARGEGGVFLPAALAVVSAALLTGLKASNLPLALPALIPLIPLWRYVILRPLRWVPVAGVALLVSFLPLAVLNHLHAGDWSGDPDNSSRMKLENPLAGVAGNVLQMAVGCLQPPVLPVPALWNEPVEKLVRSGGMERLRQDFPRLGLGMAEMPNEEGAGGGLGLTLAVVFVLAAGLASRRWRKTTAEPRIGPTPVARDWVVEGVCGAGLLAVGVYFAKMGSESTARLLAPYYPLLFLPLLRLAGSGCGNVFRSWWIVGLQASALLPLVLTPSRPLLPVAEVSGFLKEHGWGGRLGERMSQVYHVYGRRWDVLGELRTALPGDISEVGFLGSGDDIEVALWRPFGSRRVVHVLPGTALPRPEWVVVSSRALQYSWKTSPEAWAESEGYEIVRVIEVTSKVQEGPVAWVVAKKLKLRK